jgi:hypothetical protein
MAVAAFALVLAVPAAWGQRGGMRGGGVAHSVGIVHGSGSFSHSVGMTGMRGGPMGSNHSGFHSCINCVHSHPNHFHAGFRWRFGYPYYGYGYSWPWYWDTSSYDNNDSSYQADASRQIDDLSQQVQQLREQLDASQSAQYRSGPPAPPPSEIGPQPVRQDREKLPATPDLATVLVFRDQRIQEVKNYAIVGKTLVVIADERQRKIPLADLDLDATTKLNEERGVDFQLPR